MKPKFIGLCLAASLAVAAAAHGGDIPASVAAVRSFPDIGLETEVEVGQPMVLRESVLTTTSLRLLEPVRSDKYGLGVRISLRSGLYRLDHADKRGRYFAPQGMTTVGPNASWPVEGIFVPAEGDEAPIAYMEALLATSRVKTPEMKIEPVDQSGFRRELVYSGVAQKVVSVTYREYVNDFARPAFTQELKYDLNEGSEIGYRGARVEVLKATNTSIRFKLLKPLEAPAEASR